MPRPPRLLLLKSFYHIMARGNNRNIIFRKDNDYQYFIKLIKRFKKELPFDLYHYCLMPTHTHFLIRTQKSKEFSLFMKKLNLAYFYYYKTHYGWDGHFWKDRFKSQSVGKDGYFIQCGKYIELNPVRARIVKNPEDYKYSSYNFYVGNDNNDLITEDIFYESFGNDNLQRQKLYKKLVIDEKIQKNYKSNIWAFGKQKYNEAKKVQYNLTKIKP